MSLLWFQCMRQRTAELKFMRADKRMCSPNASNHGTDQLEP